MRVSAARTNILAALAFVDCSPIQSALVPEGDTARSILSLFWFFTVVCATIWVFVMALLAVAAIRRRVAAPDPVLEPDAAQERRIG